MNEWQKLKVSKSEKHFFLKPQKTNEIVDKILPYEARADVLYGLLVLIFVIEQKNKQ